MDQPQMEPQKVSNPTVLIGLILGIISVIISLLFFCLPQVIGNLFGVILGTVALILSRVAKNQIQEREGASSQTKMATATLILGIISIVLNSISLAIGLVKFIALG